MFYVCVREPTRHARYAKTSNVRAVSGKWDIQHAFLAAAASAAAAGLAVRIAQCRSGVATHATLYSGARAFCCSMCQLVAWRNERIGGTTSATEDKMYLNAFHTHDVMSKRFRDNLNIG